jgi:beta-phosphoglucomutase
MFKGVLFDMDGVLIDARDWHYIALNESLSPFDYEISESDHHGRFNGLSTKMKLRILSEEYGFPKSLHGIVETVKQDRTLRIAAQNCYPNPNHLILLSRLKQAGILTGLVTNSIRETTEYMIRSAGLINFLDVIVTNQEVTNPKPDPEGYILACKKIGLDPAEVVVIEDGDYGIEAAKRAGCEILRVAGPEEVNLELLFQVMPKLGAS